MNQSSPSVILYGQAIVLLQQIADNYSNGDVKSVQDATSQLRDVLTRFEASAGRPLLTYDPFVEGEPPLSSKINLVWDNLSSDVNILQNQMDVLRASTIFTHNLIATEVLKSAAENSRVNNKLKTLQLYSDSVDSSIITFGDNFHDDQFVDLNLSSDVFVGDGMVTLGQTGDINNLSASAQVSILDGSNGFAGNNQQITDPNLASVNPVNNQKMYTFIAESTPASDIAAITDNQPNTWFEYEHIWLSDADVFKAGNLNFTYSVFNADGNEEVDWTLGPDDGVLNLNIQFDLGNITNLNYISYTPYGLLDNANPPVLIQQVQVSSNGTDWTVINPTNVWLGTDPNLVAARTADNVVIGNAVWTFPSMQVQFVRLSIAQSQYEIDNIGHVYFMDKTSGVRVKGPTPSLPIDSYYDPDAFTSGDTVQGREYFIGKRWAIGIRDILLQQTQYVSESTVVTKSLLVNGLVDRVALEASVFIPSDYSTNENWVSFFISPDKGTTWNQISRIQDDYLGIPEIIAYNDPLPEAFHEPGVAYYNVSNPVTSLLLKIQIDRPDDQPASTPSVQSYKLKVKTR